MFSSLEHHEGHSVDREESEVILNVGDFTIAGRRNIN